MGTTLALMTALPWAQALPSSLLIIAVVHFLLFRVAYAEPEDLPRKPYVTALVQASIFYTIGHFLMRVLPGMTLNV